MNVIEAGIIASGVPLSCKKYSELDEECEDQVRDQEQQDIFKSAYISGILSFAEKLSSHVEYFEMKKKLISFKKDRINNEDIYAYLILGQEKNFGKVFDKTIKPLLDEIIKEFKDRFGDVKSFSDVNQFTDFNSFLDEKVKELTKSRFQSLKDKIF